MGHKCRILKSTALNPIFKSFLTSRNSKYLIISPNIRSADTTIILRALARTKRFRYHAVYSNNRLKLYSMNMFLTDVYNTLVFVLAEHGSHCTICKSKNSLAEPLWHVQHQKMSAGSGGTTRVD